MTELSRDEFEIQLKNEDAAEASFAIRELPAEKIAEYLSLENAELLGKRMAWEVSKGGLEFHRAEYLFYRLPDEEQKDGLEKATAKGFRNGFFEVLEKDIQGATSFLASVTRDNGSDKSHHFIDRVFSKEDIAKISKAYIEREEAGKSDPNFFTYGHFLLFLSRRPMYGDPFQNRRSAVPAEHVETYIPMARGEEREHVIQFAAANPKHSHLIGEEFFKETLRDSMTRIQPGSHFWKDVQRSKIFKAMFTIFGTKIFHDVNHAALLTGQYDDVTRLIRSLSHNNLLHICHSAEIKFLAGVCGRHEGNERYFSEIFTSMVANKRFTGCFDAEIIGAVAARLGDIPSKEDYATGKDKFYADSGYKNLVTENAEALGEMVSIAAKFELAADVKPEAFETLAEGIYRHSNTLNAFADLKLGAAVRPDLTEAFLRGARKVETKKVDCNVSASNFPEALNNVLADRQP